MTLKFLCTVVLRCESISESEIDKGQCTDEYAARDNWKILFPEKEYVVEEETVFRGIFTRYSNSEISEEKLSKLLLLYHLLN